MIQMRNHLSSTTTITTQYTNTHKKTHRNTNYFETFCRVSTCIPILPIFFFISNKLQYQPTFWPSFRFDSVSFYWLFFYSIEIYNWSNWCNNMKINCHSFYGFQTHRRAVKKLHFTQFEIYFSPKIDLASEKKKKDIYE